MIISGKVCKESNLNIKKSGIYGIKLTIERPDEDDVHIIVDKSELFEALKEVQNE